MRMHSRLLSAPRPARASQGNVIAASLPYLFAATGIVLVGVALVLQMGILVLAGAGFVVIAGAMYLIAKAVQRAEARRHPAPGMGDTGPVHKSGKKPLPPRGPLADAAVDALTRHDGPGGVWPPLSGKRDDRDESQLPQQPQQPRQTQQPTLRGPSKPANGVSMWDPHGQVGSEAFRDDPDAPRWDSQEPSEEEDGEALMEFARADTPAAGRTNVHAGSARVQSDARESETPALMERDFRVWPGAQDAGQWDRWSGRAQEERTSEQRRMASMEERRKRLAERLPTVGAILASPEKDEEPPRSGATRGKCSSCQHYLWAPRKRPITLKCPACGHKARLY